MYNKKSRTSAILMLITAALLIGFLVMLPNLEYQADEDEGIGAGILVMAIVIFGYPITYASSISFAIVALVFGIRMLAQKTRDKLIKFNRRALIATCVLLPFFALSLSFVSAMISKSQLGLFPTIYTVIVAVVYVAALITQIVTIVILKKTPEEVAPSETE